jgi:NADH:ubiquinone oxidoreductase subunit H
MLTIFILQTVRDKFQMLSYEVNTLPTPVAVAMTSSLCHPTEDVGVCSRSLFVRFALYSTANI